MHFLWRGIAILVESAPDRTRASKRVDPRYLPSPAGPKMRRKDAVKIADQWDLGMGSAPGAREELAAAVTRIFGPRSKASWLSGSFAYEGAQPGRSDIDVIVVLRDDAAMPADAATLDLVRAFVDEYLSAHARYGLDPDLEFPGEYLTPRMIDEVIAWRGLAHEGDLPADGFPPVESSDYWLGRPDRWFNAWLSETAFSRFLTGSRDYHAAVKTEAWATILRFLLLRAERSSLALDDLWDCLDQFGLKPRYPAFPTVERPWVMRALARLEAKAEADLAGDAVAPRMERLRAWADGIRAAIAGGEGHGPLLLDLERHAEIEAHAARRWKKLATAPEKAELSL